MRQMMALVDEFSSGMTSDRNRAVADVLKSQGRRAGGPGGPVMGRRAKEPFGEPLGGLTRPAPSAGPRLSARTFVVRNTLRFAAPVARCVEVLAQAGLRSMARPARCSSGDRRSAAPVRRKFFRLRQFWNCSPARLPRRAKSPAASVGRKTIRKPVRGTC
jgi:hypothetical protein